MSAIEEFQQQLADTDAKLTAANHELERLARELDRANYQIIMLANRMARISRLAAEPLPPIDSPERIE